MKGGEAKVRGRAERHGRRERIGVDVFTSRERERVANGNLSVHQFTIARRLSRSERFRFSRGSPRVAAALAFGAVRTVGARRPRRTGSLVWTCACRVSHGTSWVLGARQKLRELRLGEIPETPDERRGARGRPRARFSSSRSSSPRSRSPPRTVSRRRRPACPRWTVWGRPGTGTASPGTRSVQGNLVPRCAAYASETRWRWTNSGPSS